MNRRSFLVGLFGTAAVVALPTTILESISTPDWETAIDKVYKRYFHDFLTYGTAATVYTEEFPYIRNLSHEEWLKVPELYRSTGEY